MKIKFLLIINDKFVRMVLERRWSRARNVYGCFVDRNNISIEHFKRKYRFIEKKKLKLFGNKLIEDLIKIHTVMLSYRNIGIEKKSWMYFSNTVNKQLLYTCKRYRKIQNTIFFGDIEISPQERWHPCVWTFPVNVILNIYQITM